jgi:Ca2+-binding RTX toxin-like protein
MGTYAGTAGNDSLHGSDADNLLEGFAGADTLYGGKGNDTLSGGAGNDLIDGAGGTNTLILSGNFADYKVDWNLSFFTVTDTVAGRDGTDIAYSIAYLQFADKTVPWNIYQGYNITGTEGDDTLAGTPLPEMISGGAGNDTLYGGDGHDSVNGGTGNDLLDGGAGNDELYGYSGDDRIDGGSGDDEIYPGGGNDSIDGGIGFDSVAFSLDPVTGGVTANLQTGQWSGNGWSGTLVGVEDLFGTSYGDQFTGGPEADRLWGNDGADTLIGGAGDDTLFGGVGNDVLSGGDGNDTASYEYGGAVTVSLSTTGAQNTWGAGTDTLSEIENLTGSSGGDYLYGDGRANAIDGGVGNDYVDGGAGNDLLLGGAGNDTLFGGSGDDTLSGGDASQATTDRLDGRDGNDTASFSDLAGPVSANLALGTSTSGLESVVLVSIENFIGSASNDILTGDSNPNTIDGGAGGDTITGGGGNDLLTGGSGLDTAVFTGAAANHAVSVTGSIATIADRTGGGEGTDTLVQIERLEFSDEGIALDLSGSAGEAAMAIAAVFGPGVIQDEHMVGLALQELDAGTSFQDLVQLALEARLGPDPTHRAVVDLLFTNVVGVAPSATQEATFVALLDFGQFSEAGLGAIAAQHPLNLANINIDLLASTGLPFEWFG